MADEGEVSIQMDALARAVQAGASASISPQSLLLAWTDWASHLASSPGKQSELMSLAAEQASAPPAICANAFWPAQEKPAIASRHRCRIGASLPRSGVIGRSTCCIRSFCSTSSGGRRPPMAYPAWTSTTRTWWPSRPDSGWNALSRQPPADQSRGAGTHRRRGWREPAARPRASARRPRALAGQAAARGGGNPPRKTSAVEK